MLINNINVYPKHSDILNLKEYLNYFISHPTHWWNFAASDYSDNIPEKIWIVQVSFL